MCPQIQERTSYCDGNPANPTVGFPLRETAPRVALEAAGRSIAILGGLASSFMTIAETHLAYVAAARPAATVLVQREDDSRIIG